MKRKRACTAIIPYGVKMNGFSIKLIRELQTVNAADL
jgi:hypothetical protein